MTVPHFMFVHWKITTAALAIVGSVVYSMDPTVKVAIITGLFAAIPSTGMMVLQFLSRRDLKKSLSNQEDLKHSMDGNFNRLWTEKNEQTGQLADKSEKLARAEGHREGSDEERNKST